MSKNRDPRDPSIFLFLLNVITPHKQWAAATVSCSVASAATALLLTFFTKQLVSQTMAGRIMPGTASVFVLLVVVSALVAGLLGYTSGKLGAVVGRDLKRSVAAKVMQADYRSVQEMSSGDAVSVVNNDCNQVTTFLTSDLFSLVTQTLTALCAFVYLLSLHPLLGLLTFAYTPVGMVLAAKINRRLNTLYPVASRQKGEVLSAVEQALTSLPVIKTFTMERTIKGKLDQTFASLYETDKRMKWWDALLQPACLSVANTPNLIFTVVGGLFALSGQLELGAFIAITQLLAYIIPPTVMLPFMINGLNQSAASMKRIDRILTLPMAELPEPSIMTEAARVWPPVPSIQLKNVSFAYAVGKPVLTNVSFTLEGPGITVIVGGSGSGKSTLGALLTGLYRSFDGTIRLCGKQLSHMNDCDIGKMTAVLPQDIHLFSASILDNIRIGNESAGDSDLFAAARAAGVHEYAVQKEHGFHTMIGDGGAALSGGQAQKLGLSRVILKDAPIWFLDEPTSALDASSEDQAHMMLRSKAEAKLILIAAHRMSTIRLADRIIFLKDGAVAANGTWEEVKHNADLVKSLRMAADADSEESEAKAV